MDQTEIECRGAAAAGFDDYDGGAWGAWGSCYAGEEAVGADVYEGGF